jgi:hypothetical protein
VAQGGGEVTAQEHKSCARAQDGQGLICGRASRTPSSERRGIVNFRGWPVAIISIYECTWE